VKKIILIICSIVLLFTANNIFAQKNKSQVESPEVKAKIESLILDVEKKADNPFQLNKAIRLLHFHLNRNRNSQVYVAPETTRDVTIKLMNIFNNINDIGTNAANKIRIIETIGRSDNSFEAHQFFITLFNVENERYRIRALRSLSPKGVHGNDIYDEIKGMVKKGVLTEFKALSSLKKANSQRALPKIQKFVKETNALKEFVGAGLLLCFYDDPNEIDILFDRYEEFNEKLRTQKKDKNDINYNLPIPTKLMLKYIQIKEGKRFKIALELLNKEGVSDEEEFPLILPKLKSKDIVTREAVVSFLENQAIRGSVKEGVVIPILEEAERNEKDKELKDKINKKIAILKRRKQIKWKRN
jgi:hypothetical protein